jgi:hypothetical protein
MNSNQLLRLFNSYVADAPSFSRLQRFSMFGTVSLSATKFKRLLLL